MGRADLIGNGKKHLIPSFQPAGTGKTLPRYAGNPLKNRASTRSPAGSPMKNGAKPKRARRVKAGAR